MKVYLGGTFDPVHKGHIQLATELVSIFNLAQLYLMPCYKAVHKDTVTASAHQRLDMLKIAINECSCLVLDEREINKTGPSYTYESLKDIRKEVGEDSLSFVMGMDSLFGFPEWYKAECISRLANLIIIDRPSSSFNFLDSDVVKAQKDSIERLIEFGFSMAEDYKELEHCRSGKILILKLSLYDISSSEVREKIKKRESIKHLVSDGVAEFIQKHHLYQ